MKEVIIVVEGETEERFVDEVLYPNLVARGVWPQPRKVGIRRKSNPSRGGAITSYRALRLDLVTAAKEHARRGAYLTTMVDLYALPSDVPGFRTAAQTPDPCRRVRHIEEAMVRDLDLRRFMPHVQLHEFEALVFVDPGVLVATGPTDRKCVDRLVRATRHVDDPELINCGPDTHPLRRLAKHIPGYDKPAWSIRAVRAIGLPAIRAKYPHFSDWVTRLEALGTDVRDDGLG